MNPLHDCISGFNSFLKGMSVTLSNLLRREKITVLYPYEKVDIAPRYRGLFVLPFNEDTKRLNCTGCTLCIQACPTNVISLTKHGAGKHGGISDFQMDLGRCMFCNLCVEACPFEAIEMTTAFELASTHRDICVFPLTALAQGGADSVRRNDETITTALATEAAAKEAAAKAKAAAAAKAAADSNTAATGEATPHTAKSHSADSTGAGS